MRYDDSECFSAKTAIYPSLSGKTAIITGASSGIGRATAILLAKNGVRTCLLGRNDKALSELADGLRTRGHECLVCPADVTKEEDIKKAFSSCREKFGRIDILCNVAGGSMGLSRDTVSLTLEDWKAVMDLNINNVFLCCREVLTDMKSQGYGRIVNVSSLSGVVAGEVANSAYASAKAAIDQFTRHLAREVGPFGISVNAVCPGYTLSSERIERFWESSDMESIFKRLAIKRAASAREQACVILFLASDEASYITGEVTDVNGGAIFG